MERIPVEDARAGDLVFPGSSFNSAAQDTFNWRPATAGIERPTPGQPSGGRSWPTTPSSS